MHRLIGGMLIIAATTWAGLLYGRELQDYLEKLWEIRRILSMLKGEMAYSHAPLSEIFARLGQRTQEPYRQWFAVMCRQTEERFAEQFASIWNASVESELKELHLKAEHKALLREVGAGLGQADRWSQDRHLELYLERLEVEIEKVQGEIAAKKRIGKCLGVMGGIFLVVILI